jgi:DNA polymerase III subunit gamma/tau
MYQVIARKYRPQTFSELVGQEHVRTTLGNAIGQNRIAHGYIFSGQRGTGKTTVARIMARCLNCEKGPTIEPCLTCSACREIAAGNCIDVIEIDAASNRGINEMRELRENVRFRPARDRFKVFVIDEAHQITSDAFNALLKTLEEPPEWVAFILCTTESHKIPATIASRCQQFSFRSVDFKELVTRMRWICGEEKIEADDEALAVIAQVGEGSVRDSLSALDQAIACCGAKLTEPEIRELLGVFSLDSLGEVTLSLAAADSQRMLQIVQELESNGRHLQHFCRELARYFRNLLVAKVMGAQSRLIAASDAEQGKMLATAAGFSEEDLTRYLHITLELYRELQYSLQPRLHLELGLLRLIHASRLVSLEEALAGVGPSSAAVAAPAAPKPMTARAPVPPSTSSFRAEAASSPPPPWSTTTAVTTTPPTGGDARGRLLAYLRENNVTAVADAVEESQLRESPAEWQFTGSSVFTLAFKDAALKAAVQKIAGRAVRISFVPSEGAGGGGSSVPKAAPVGEDEATRRALDNPEVKSFQEQFPGSQVRTVRNLKE